MENKTFGPLADWQGSSALLRQDLGQYTFSVRCDGIWLKVWGNFIVGIVELILQAGLSGLAKRTVQLGNHTYEVLPPPDRVTKWSELIIKDISAGIQLKVWDCRGWEAGELFKNQQHRCAVQVALYPRFFLRHEGDIMAAYAELIDRLGGLLSITTYETINRFDLAIDVGGLPLRLLWDMVVAGCLKNKLSRAHVRHRPDNEIYTKDGEVLGTFQGDSWASSLVTYDKIKHLKRFEKDYADWKYYYEEHGDDLRHLTRMEIRLGSLLKTKWKRIVSFHLFLNHLPTIVDDVFQAIQMYEQPYNSKNPSRNVVHPFWTHAFEAAQGWAKKQKWDPTKYYQASNGMPNPIPAAPKKVIAKHSITAVQNSVGRALNKFAAFANLNMADPDVRAVLLNQAIFGSWKVDGHVLTAAASQLKQDRKDQEAVVASFLGGGFRDLGKARGAIMQRNAQRILGTIRLGSYVPGAKIRVPLVCRVA